MKRLRKTDNETTLQKHVRCMVNRKAKGYDDISFFFEDLMEGGCQSGIIGELIYYTDTIKFYNKHQADIDALLQGMCEDCGCRPDELFGDKWEKEDPLARDTLNMNLLAWFGFEETARNLALDAGIEL